MRNEELDAQFRINNVIYIRVYSENVMFAMLYRLTGGRGGL